MIIPNPWGQTYTFNRICEQTTESVDPLRVSGILSFLDIEFPVKVENLPAFFKLTASIFIDMILSTLF